MITSRITRKSQTTIPRGVRDALELRPGDELAYEVHPGYAIVRPVRAEDEDDAALGPFLALLAGAIRRSPETLRPITPALAGRIRELVGDGDFDPDEPIHGDVAL